MSDLSMTRGNTYQFDLTFTGVASLAGCTVRWQARYSYSDANPVISKSTASPPGGIVDTSAGQVVSARVTLLPTDTSSLTGQTVLMWDAELTEPDGSVHTVASGKLTVTPNVTM